MALRFRKVGDSGPKVTIHEFVLRYRLKFHFLIKTNKRSAKSHGSNIPFILRKTLLHIITELVKKKKIRIWL